MGSRKCKEKKNFKVDPPTLNLLQTHIKIILPKTGIALKNFVITVAAQKDICPQGNT